jgi:hypothetical protein
VATAKNTPKTTAKVEALEAVEKAADTKAEELEKSGTLAALTTEELAALEAVANQPKRTN